jgi:hypothetical protein
MGAKIIDGKQVAAELRQRLKEEVAELARKGVTPGLATVLVGEDPASQVYVRMKEKACGEIGIMSRGLRPPADIPQDELIAQLEELNRDPAIHGILVQLPLPKHLDTAEVLGHVSPEKDVDGFHPLNLGKLLSAKYWDELPKFVPCTPAGGHQADRLHGCGDRGEAGRGGRAEHHRREAGGDAPPRPPGDRHDVPLPDAGPRGRDPRGRHPGSGRGCPPAHQGRDDQARGGA